MAHDEVLCSRVISPSVSGLRELTSSIGFMKTTIAADDIYGNGVFAIRAAVL